MRLILLSLFLCFSVFVKAQFRIYYIINDEGGRKADMSDGIRAVVYTNGNIEYYLAGLRQHSPSKTIAQTPKLSEDKGYGLYLGEGNKTGDYKSFYSEFRPLRMIY